MPSNPFADPNAIWRNGVRVKDIKLQPPKKVPPAPAPTPMHPASGAFSLEDLADCYRISGVPYRGQTGTYDLSKALLEGSSHKPLADWISYSVQARSRGDYEVPSAPLLHSLINTLHLHHEDAACRASIERVRTFLKTTVEQTWVWTLSQVRYEPAGQDCAVHDVGLPTEHVTFGALVGPDEWLKNAPSASAIYPTVWNDTPAHMQAEYHWLTGRNAYLWRVNKTPKEKADGRGVACGVDSGDGFILSAHGSLGYGRPAFGVRRAKNFP